MSHTYSPAQVALNVHGYPISGFAKGTFITVKRSSDSFKKEVGSDGEVVWTKSADDSGEIEITLMQSSQSNDVLQSRIDVDELTGMAIGPTFIKDNRGTTVCLGTESRVQKPADADFDQEVKERKWTISVAHLKIHNGGILL